MARITLIDHAGTLYKRLNLINYEQAPQYGAEQLT
jgi:hypothetical protein